jgi:hypothetical protein
MGTDGNDWAPVVATEELREDRATKVEAFGTTAMLYRSGETGLRHRQPMHPSGGAA